MARRPTDGPWNGRLTADDIIDNYVIPTQENTAEIKRAVHLLATFLKNKSGCNVAKVYKAGSLKKGTNVRGFSDIDLVVFLNDFESMENCISSLPYVLDKLEKQINRWGGNERWEMAVERETRHSLKVRLTDDVLDETIHVDILPTFDTVAEYGMGDTYAEMDEVSEDDREFYSPSLTELQCNWVKEKIDDVPNVRDLIRLVKFWRKTELPHEKGYPTSYLLELLTIRTWENVHRSKDGLPSEFSMEKAFKRVLLELVKYQTINMGCRDNYDRGDYANAPRRQHGWPFIMDPANPFNNVCSLCTMTDWWRVAQAAQRTCNSPLLANVPSQGRWDF